MITMMKRRPVLDWTIRNNRIKFPRAIDHKSWIKSSLNWGFLTSIQILQLIGTNNVQGSSVSVSR